MQELANVTFELNQDRKWTLELLEHMRTHSECYGLTDAIVSAKETTLNGGGTPVFGDSSTTDYKLFYDSDYVGHVTFNLDDSDSGTYEMHIAIFDKYKCKGIAKSAICAALKQYHPADAKTIIATVKQDNPNREKVVGILKGRGFKWIEGLTFSCDLSE